MKKKAEILKSILIKFFYLAVLYICIWAISIQSLISSTPVFIAFSTLLLTPILLETFLPVKWIEKKFYGIKGSFLCTLGVFIVALIGIYPHFNLPIEFLIELF